MQVAGFSRAGFLMQTVAKSKKPSPFAARLRALRDDAGLTQQKVADEVGVNIHTYMRWESGKTEPTFTELCTIAALFGKTPNDFMPSEE